jgi:cyclopropane fatty-acyl-phospholipid synthase-like methyltransferase
MAKKQANSVSVRIWKRQYKMLQQRAKQTGHSIAWLLAAIIDNHFVNKEVNRD